MCLLNNASVYCQQTQHSLLVSGLLSVLRCNWRRKAVVLLLGDNSESNTSGLCVALHTLYHLVWSYLLGYGFHSILVILFLIYYSYLVLIPILVAILHAASYWFYFPNPKPLSSLRPHSATELLLQPRQLLRCLLCRYDLESSKKRYLYHVLKVLSWEQLKTKHTTKPD